MCWYYTLDYKASKLPNNLTSNATKGSNWFWHGICFCDITVKKRRLNLPPSFVLPFQSIYHFMNFRERASLKKLTLEISERQDKEELEEAISNLQK